MYDTFFHLQTIQRQYSGVRRHPSRHWVICNPTRTKSLFSRPKCSHCIEHAAQHESESAWLGRRGPGRRSYDFEFSARLSFFSSFSRSISAPTASDSSFGTRSALACGLISSTMTLLSCSSSVRSALVSLDVTLVLLATNECAVWCHLPFFYPQYCQ